MSMFDDEPGGGRLNPADCLGHLLMVWSTGYIEHSPTKYTVPGKKSDVVIVDVVDLDQADEDGYQGLVVRSVWWRNARLIGLMKNRIGRAKPVLGWMAKGEAVLGNPPFEIHFAVDDEDAVARAQAWFQAHADFRPSTPQGNTDAARVQADAPQAREMSNLERLAAQSVLGSGTQTHQQLLRDVVSLARNPPLPPPRPQPVDEDDVPPF